MTPEFLLRVLAVAAAVAIIAAPYWSVFVSALQGVMDWARRHSALLSRAAAAALIVAAAWGKIPMPQLPQPQPLPTVHVETPSDEMRNIVAKVSAELEDLPMIDRLLWASVWSKSALVVAGDATAKEVAFTDTRSLRGFVALTLDIAWRRIGKHEPGSNETLRKAVEDAYAAAIGSDIVPVGKDVRERYAEFARAMAWAGLHRG